MLGTWKTIKDRAFLYSAFHAVRALEPFSSLMQQVACYTNDVSVTKDVYYGDRTYTEPRCRLNIYDSVAPLEYTPKKPVLFYVHGGGFATMCKDSAWMMPVEYAKMGYKVVSINYRLAPEHPYPAAMEDVCTAYEWVVKNIDRYGGDPENIVVAGESAGANLILGLVIATLKERTEPFAKKVFPLNAVPKAILAISGIYCLSDVSWVHDVLTPEEGWMKEAIVEMKNLYYGHTPLPPSEKFDLVDALYILEDNPEILQKFPPTYILTSGKCPVMHDSNKLHELLKKIPGVELDYVADEVHAYCMFPWKPEAVKSYQRIKIYLDKINNLGYNKTQSKENSNE